MKVFLERWSRNALSGLLGIIFPIRKRTPDDVHALLQKNPAAKIFFIRPHQGLGDLLLATPIFRALKKAYPHSQIHFMADTYNAVAIRSNRRLDRIWVWDKKKMRGPFKFGSFIRALRKEKFLIAIPLSSHVPSFTSYLIARLSGAQVVMAYDTKLFYGGANWSKHLAHVELPNYPDTAPEWVKFMGLVRPLITSSFPAVVGVPFPGYYGKGQSPVGDGESRNDSGLGEIQELRCARSMVPLPEPAGDDGEYAPEFDVGEQGEAWARDEWRKLALPSSPRKKIGLFFGGNPDRPERLWPAAYWGDLAVKLQQRPDAQLVAIVPPKDFLSGSRALECGVYGQIAPRLSPAPPIFADSDLFHVAAFLKGLDLFVCVDGGLFHIAAGAGVKTLGLFFKTDPARWKPPVPWAVVLRPEDDLPASLSPEEVYQKICEMVLKSNVKC